MHVVGEEGCVRSLSKACSVVGIGAAVPVGSRAARPPFGPHQESASTCSSDRALTCR